MTLIINGKATTLDVQTLADALELLGYQSQQGRCVVALNQIIVPWVGASEQRLQDGDHIDVLGAITGG